MSSRTVEYIDTSATGGGDGTESDPYDSLQEALDTSSGPDGHGALVWLCKGSETLDSSGLDVSGVSWWSSPDMLIQGYGSTVGDGGLYGINMNGTSWPVGFNEGYSILKSLSVTNPGTTATKFWSAYSRQSTLIDCHFSDFNTDTHVLSLDQPDNAVINCSFTDINARCIEGRIGVIDGCMFFNSGTREITECINTKPYTITNCIFSLDGATDGITGTSDAGRDIYNNSFYCASGGTGHAIRDYKGNRIHGNIIEGFAIGIQCDNLYTHTKQIVEANSFYNCTMNVGDGTTASPANLTYGNWRIIGDSGGLGQANETLSNSPFAKSGSATSWSNRRAYFEPQDEGSVLGGALNGNSRGAVQLTSGGGGSSTVVTPGPVQIGM